MSVPLRFGVAPDCLLLCGLVRAQGTMGIFVNGHGFIHQTLTLSRVVAGALVLDFRPPSLVDTWFEGYAWTIAHCRRCGAHVGWQYDRAVRGDGTRRFWGFRQDAIRSVAEDSGSEASEGSGEVEGWGSSEEEEGEEESGSGAGSDSGGED